MKNEWKYKKMLEWKNWEVNPPDKDEKIVIKTKNDFDIGNWDKESGLWIFKGEVEENEILGWDYIC